MELRFMVLHDKKEVPSAPGKVWRVKEHIESDGKAEKDKSELSFSVGLETIHDLERCYIGRLNIPEIIYEIQDRSKTEGITCLSLILMGGKHGVVKTSRGRSTGGTFKRD
ncbi:hypothetical protein VNO78_07793 [Psophocarpus tetragonolobus]|uniref:Uncharacterized protein n=1 Tax=Psophocarpus tetragonolobus TaxID=3891 RepID=A0AAN9T3V7_PSOTE